VRRIVGRSLVLAAVAAALVVAWSQSVGSASSSFTLMQMNLCLSGLSACYVKTDYPAVLQETVARIRDADPDAVTLNETCRGDVARIARQTGYHMRFTQVIYQRKRLQCVRPGGRGLFGDAVLTKAPIEHSESQVYRSQAGPERRMWMCVTTQAVDVCTSHVNTLSPGEARANATQCAELAAMLARRASARTVIYGGDVNRRRPCAPAGLWIRSDSSARQDPGLQQVYGSGALRSPSAKVLSAEHTDHDFLLVRAHLSRRR
jgi:endonuclease/exonuclease/phosphatase family metal-dependent hydrolase